MLAPRPRTTFDNRSALSQTLGMFEISPEANSQTSGGVGGDRRTAGPSYTGCSQL
jgi:hypothetical protein